MLLLNPPIVSRIWGPGSAYWQPYREILGYKFPFTFLQEAGPGLVWACYLVTIALVVAFTLGWQGSLWQDGTAVYYPLQSEAYGALPPLADLMTHWTFPVVIATYVTVLAQVAFPFLLFNKITRRFALIVLLGMHLSIAVAMGLPFFSGIMASADAVLVSGATWVAIVTWLRIALTENRAALALRANIDARRTPQAAEAAADDSPDSTTEPETEPDAVDESSEDAPRVAAAQTTQKK